MAVFQVKKYKIIKDENGNKVQVQKTQEEWNKETCSGTKTWYFSTRYEINQKRKQYKSKLFPLKREAQDEERLFLNNPIEYIQSNSKRAKNKLNENIIERGMGIDEICILITQRLRDTADVIRSTYAHQYENVNDQKLINLLK